MPTVVRPCPMTSIPHCVAFYFNRNGKCPPGSPKQRWQDTLEGDMKIAQLDPDAAFDHARWCSLIQNLDPATAGIRLGR